MFSIIINPVSGGAAPADAHARAQLAAARVAAADETADITLTVARGHAHDLAQAAVRRGDRLVIAWGGDGTVNEVASALIGTETRLGMAPGGSGNGLARELHLPPGAGAALDFAMRAASRSIDAGEL